MIVTLYRKCILNKSHSEKFRTRPFLNTHLSRLKKTVININPVNIGKTGIIKLYINDENKFLYNYMKIETEEGTEFPIYAFIDKIYTENSVMCYQYEVDTWHTYLGNWTLRYGLLTNTSDVVNYPVREIDMPLDYITNSELVLNNFETFNKGYIIVRYQKYTVVSGTTNTNASSVYTAVFSTNNIEDFGYEFYIGENGIPNVRTMITDLINIQANGKIGNYNFKVLNVWIIPSAFISIFDLSVEYEEITVNNSNIYRFTLLKFITYDSKITYTLPANPKIRSVGIYAKQFPYLYNGKEKKYSIRIDSTPICGIKVYLCSEDGLNEITDLFQESLYFDVVTGDVLAQREIEAKMGTINGIGRVVNGVTQIATSAGALIATGGASEGSEIALAGALKLAKFNQPEAKGLNKLGNQLENYENANSIGGVGGIVSGAVNIVKGVAEIKYANAEKYRNCTFTNNIPNGLLNARIGVCYFSLDDNSIINSDEVENAIKYCGYSVHTIVNDISQNSTTEYVTFLKFASVEVRGLSTELNNEIAKTLIDGVRIWYTGIIPD